MRYLVSICLLITPGATAPLGAQRDGALTASSFDSATYADEATYQLVELARARHAHQSAALRSYRASIFTQLEGRIGPSRFAPGLTLFDYQTAAVVHWEAPGHTRVDVLGARAAAPRFPLVKRQDMGGYWAEMLAGEPWFIPAAMGDDIQLMGIPDEEALHPLAHQGAGFYRYQIVDSLRIGLPDRTVRAVAIAVRPRDYALVAPRPDHARPRAPVRTLVQGELWIDADSLDVVRLTVTLLGPDIWDDDPDSPELVAMETDLEYGLVLNRFWLPYRQVLSAKFVYRYLPGATLPATAVTTFADYDLNVADSLVFATRLDTGPGSGRRYGRRWRCEPWVWEDDYGDDCGDGAFVSRGERTDGTEWEVVVPAWDSLQRFDFGSTFEHTVDLASTHLIEERLGRLASLSEAVPAAVRPDPSMAPLDWRAALELFRFNRVQGPSVGTSARLPVPLPYTTVSGRVRMGLGDERLTGAVQLRREGPGARLDVEGFREIVDIEPWTAGTGIGNSFKALFAGHDDADYLLAEGGGFIWSGYHAPWHGVHVALAYQRERSVSRVAGSFVNDVFFGNGDFNPNPAVTPGDFLRLRVERSHTLGPVSLSLGAEAARSSDRTAARFWGTLSAPFRHGPVLGAVRIRGGTAAGDTVRQMMWRAGGPATVRGFDYGLRTGRRVWAAQGEVEYQAATWWGPYGFVDVGNVDRLGDPLVGVGGGVSLLSGWLRIQLAKGVRPAVSMRADVLVQIPSY
jgi:hypothetical protein